MMTTKRLTPLIERLPRVRGELEAGAAIARFTWFKVGGPAEALFQPADAEDLAAFLASDRASFLTGSSVVLDGGMRQLVP